MLAPDAQGKTPLWLTARHLGRKLFTKLWKRHKSRQALAEGGRTRTHTPVGHQPFHPPPSQEPGRSGPPRQASAAAAGGSGSRQPSSTSQPDPAEALSTRATAAPTPSPGPWPAAQAPWGPQLAGRGSYGHCRRSRRQQVLAGQPPAAQSGWR